MFDLEVRESRGQKSVKVGGRKDFEVEVLNRVHGVERAFDGLGRASVGIGRRR